MTTDTCPQGRKTFRTPISGYLRHADDPNGNDCQCKERRKRYPWEYRTHSDGACTFHSVEFCKVCPEERRAPGQVTDRRVEERRKYKHAIWQVRAVAGNWTSSHKNRRFSDRRKAQPPEPLQITPEWVKEKAALEMAQEPTEPGIVDSARLIENAACASQSRALADDAVIREAIEANIITPLRTHIEGLAARIKWLEDIDPKGDEDGCNPLSRTDAVRLCKLQMERINELEDELRLLDRTAAQQSELLTGVVNAIRGTPPPLTLWGHRDAADLAEAVVVALRPFAEEAAAYYQRAPDKYNIRPPHNLTVGHVRQAARLLGLPENREAAEE